MYIGQVDVGPRYDAIQYAIEQAAENHPNVKWLTLVSDETFVFPTNLFCYLSSLVDKQLVEPKQV